MALDKKHAEEIILEFEKLGVYGLHLNKNKTKIITDLPELKNAEEISGIKIVRSFKYLG
jgi:hypothetical protein